MELHTQTNEFFDNCFKSQKLLWERWIELARKLEETTPDNPWLSPADSLNILNEQAQSAIEINKEWARLWVDSLEHGNQLVGTLAVSGNRHLSEYQAQTYEQFGHIVGQIKGLAEQARVLDVDRAWVRQWLEGLDQDHGMVAAMAAWNRQIIEQQTEARQQFLNAWVEVFQNFEPSRWVNDASTRQSAEMLQDAIKKAMTIPFGLPAAVDEEQGKKSAPARRSAGARAKNA